MRDKRGSPRLRDSGSTVSSADRGAGQELKRPLRGFVDRLIRGLALGEAAMAHCRAGDHGEIGANGRERRVVQSDRAQHRVVAAPVQGLEAHATYLHFRARGMLTAFSRGCSGSSHRSIGTFKPRGVVR